MAKSEVYSWRLEPELKDALENTARRESTSVSRLLDRIVGEWLTDRAASDADEEHQRALHAAARKTFGTVSGLGPYSAERLREIVRRRLEERYGRKV